MSYTKISTTITPRVTTGMYTLLGMINLAEHDKVMKDMMQNAKTYHDLNQAMMYYLLKNRQNSPT